MPRELISILTLLRETNAALARKLENPTNQNPANCDVENCSV